MAKQPLGNFQITNPDGTPTEYFIRWLTSDDAEAAVDDCECFHDAPKDGKTYARKNGGWVEIYPVPPGGKAGQILTKASDADGDLTWGDAPISAGADGFLTTDGDYIVADGDKIEA